MNPSTGLLYQGPKPPGSVLKLGEQRLAAPAAGDTEPCPWENVHSGNHELIAIPGPPEVLYNKLGVTSAETAHDLEDRGMVRANRYMHEQVTATTPIRVTWLVRFHRLAFGDLYTWAGRYRTVRIAKEGKFPFNGWCLPQHIGTEMERFERDFLVTLTPTTPADVQTLPLRIATLMSEFLLIHPFREGNGRIALMMGDWLALQAGLPPIAYGINDDSDRKDAYFQALHHGYNQIYAPVAQFVADGIERSLKILGRRTPPPP
jgi:cell filamentation protein